MMVETAPSSRAVDEECGVERGSQRCRDEEEQADLSGRNLRILSNQSTCWSRLERLWRGGAFAVEAKCVRDKFHAKPNDRALQTLLSVLLTRAGFECDFVSDGREAMQKLDGDGNGSAIPRCFHERFF